jgi:hypothetical protein
MDRVKNPEDIMKNPEDIMKNPEDRMKNPERNLTDSQYLSEGLIDSQYQVWKFDSLPD